MCGIVGIFDSRGERAIDPALLSTMNDSQTHRGPDGSGLFIDAGVGLGHRRLAIIDLEGGHQPLFNEDHSVVVVYNGEIFNFRELAEQLEAAGHRFRTRCDTEVIVHAWEEWGEACVERFRGQFAFALWDKQQRTLFLARDRLGIKPLYYAILSDGMVVFGSELKSLLCYPGLPREIDACAVEDYFGLGYIPDPCSIYRSVSKLAPAHTLTLRRGGPVATPKRYWSLSMRQRLSGSPEDISAELAERLEEAVKMRLMSDVPLGAFLSGGVDSSAVVAMMARNSSDAVDTCSISFDDPSFDESRYARQMAERYGTRHHVDEVDPEDFDLVDRLATIYDEPFADSSAIPTYRVCASARRHVTVALSGDGGDEVYAGYRRHRWHYNEEVIRQKIPLFLRRPVFGLLGAAYPKLDWAPKYLRAKTTFQAIAKDSAEAYFETVSVTSTPHRRRLLSGLQPVLQGHSAVDRLRHWINDAEADDPLARVQHADIQSFLPGDILTKVDRASMANSLEVRVPFLDHHLVEWSAGLPIDLRLRGRNGKYILKKAMEPHVPHEILYRDKMGFAVPLAGWFRGPLKQRIRESLLGPTLEGTGYFDMGYVRRLVDEHQQGRFEHSSIIWSLVMFESFLRQVHMRPVQPVTSRDGWQSQLVGSQAGS